MRRAKKAQINILAVQDFFRLDIIGQNRKHITLFENTIVLDFATAVYPIRSDRILTTFAPFEIG